MLNVSFECLLFWLELRPPCSLFTRELRIRFFTFCLFMASSEWREMMNELMKWGQHDKGWWQCVTAIRGEATQAATASRVDRARVQELPWPGVLLQHGDRCHVLGTPRPGGRWQWHPTGLLTTLAVSLPSGVITSIARGPHWPWTLRVPGTPK